MTLCVSRGKADWVKLAAMSQRTPAEQLSLLGPSARSRTKEKPTVQVNDTPKQFGSFSEIASFIWSIADLLRGDFKRHEYGQVILPFTVGRAPARTSRVGCRQRGSMSRPCRRRRARAAFPCGSGVCARFRCCARRSFPGDRRGRRRGRLRRVPGRSRGRRGFSRRACRVAVRGGSRPAGRGQQH